MGESSLVVGMSGKEIHELEEIALAAFGWSSIFVMALALTGGAIIAARAQRRLDVIGKTMDDIAHGDLGARIPLIGNGDDIDQLSADVNQALARLSSLVEGMRQVSTDIAHDLKTPLNRLKMTIETAATNSERGLPVSEELAAALAESDCIDETFSALLRIAQIESGVRKSRFMTIDVADLLQNLVDIFREVAIDAGQSLSFERQGAVEAPILGDRELLTQMFANLIENAIRHCPKGARIDCALGLDRRHVTARVADNGPGIPEFEHENVLRRLYRLDKSRTTSGSGLGLSLAKAIADLHDASLQLSDNAPGLCVTVQFTNSGTAKSSSR